MDAKLNTPRHISEKMPVWRMTPPIRAYGRVFRNNTSGANPISTTRVNQVNAMNAA